MTGRGLELPFEVLFDEDSGDRESRSLISEVSALYGSDWTITRYENRPYCFSNFVMSHDGRVSYGVLGHEGGGDVSGFNPHDQWLMGLLRCRADAVMVGANTLRSEPEHLWTSDFIAPGDAQILEKQRRADGRKSPPLQVFVTSSGEIFPDAAVFQHSELQVLIVTTEKARVSVEALALPRTSLLIAGSDEVDFSAAMKVLYAEWGVRTLLCEGGPRLYGSLIKSGCLDEEFLTVSPLVIGSTKDAPRPGLIEGSSFLPGKSPRASLVSARRAGDHLFIRTKWQLPQG